jgi:effector-binding domain-containing protein
VSAPEKPAPAGAESSPGASEPSPPADTTAGGAPGAAPGPAAVEIVELGEVRVATIRAVVDAGDVPDFMADALAMVAAALGAAGVAPAGPPFARYFSMGAEGLDVAAGFPVAEPFLGAGVVHPGELPAGPAAVTTYVGPHEGLEAAWADLRRRIDGLGRRRGDDPWEVFFIGPGSGVGEAQWRTELSWPLLPVETAGAATPGGEADGADAPGSPPAGEPA